MTESIAKQNLTYGGSTVELVSVKMRTSNGAPRGKRTTCHYKAMCHGLIDGNYMNICRPMRLGDFLASKDLQELNYVDSVERKSLKNLAVIIPNGMIGLSS